MNLFTIQPCADKGGLSAKLVKPTTLDLAKIKKSFTIVIDTPYVLVIRQDGHEIIVHDYGELVFKDLTDETKIRTIADNIFAVGLPEKCRQ